MSDIKFFKILEDSIQELHGQSLSLEKSLQNMIEKNLETFLGIQFLATEYSTGKRHGGRIDTLGIDENNSPVIIEYKRSMNENVINQGLYYLDWLLDHKAEFELMTMRQYGNEVADNIDWSSPRLLCIAGSFTKFDTHAVQQINRNIELYHYKYFEEGFLMLDLVNASTEQSTAPSNTISPAKTNLVELDSAKKQWKTVTDYIEQANEELTDRYENLKAFILALSDDVQEKVLKYYIAFKRIKNFCCVEVHPQTNVILCYVKLDPTKITLEPGFTRDVTNIGHYGTGNLEIRISTNEQLEKAKILIEQSHDLN